MSVSLSIDAIGEDSLIDRIRKRVGPDRPFVSVGIGDDAAVLVPERSAVEVVTTDSLVEGVHFRRDWTAARDIGHKALAVNLSDLAAMGATPRACLLSLALPGTFALDDFDDLIEGFVGLAEASGTALVGGNLTRSPGLLMIDVTAIGSARRRRVLRRSGAKGGHDLYVTGKLGAAAAGLGWLSAGIDRGSLDADGLECVSRYEKPIPRWRLGGSIGRSGTAAAAIDLSDGLADGVDRLARANGLEAVIDAASVPVHPGVATWAAHAGLDALSLAVQGGDDYELLFAVPPRRRSRFAAAARRQPDTPVTRIGRLVRGSGSWLERDGVRAPLPRGFRHF